MASRRAAEAMADRLLQQQQLRNDEAKQKRDKLQLQRDAHVSSTSGLLGDIVGGVYLRPTQTRLESGSIARPGYADAVTKSEYQDVDFVLDAKIKLLASILSRASNAIAYTGAGISRSAGMQDYASVENAKSESGGAKTVSEFVTLSPTRAHRGLAALFDAGKLNLVVTQNHDRLHQKAGLPQSATCEIHGAWGDDLNPTLAMSDPLRSDLQAWLEESSRLCDLCISIGTSLAGMQADLLARCVSDRFFDGSCDGGLVIINLQQTSLDRVAALRIYGDVGEVLPRLAQEMGIEYPNARMDERGRRWIEDHPGNRYSTPPWTPLG